MVINGGRDLEGQMSELIRETFHEKLPRLGTDTSASKKWGQTGYGGSKKVK